MQRDLQKSPANKTEMKKQRDLNDAQRASFFLLSISLYLCLDLVCTCLWSVAFARLVYTWIKRESLLIHDVGARFSLSFVSLFVFMSSSLVMKQYDFTKKSFKENYQKDQHIDVKLDAERTTKETCKRDLQKRHIQETFKRELTSLLAWTHSRIEKKQMRMRDITHTCRGVR